MSRTVYAVLTFTLLALSTMNLAESLDAKCELLSSKHVAEMRDKIQKNYALVSVTSFYTPTLDSCIHTEVADVGVSYQIRDLTYSLLRDGGMRNLLLDCDADGANSVVVEKIRKYRGRVYSVPFIEWLDDGFGGPPSTLQTPANLYTKADCQKVFDKWMSYLRR